MSSTNTLTGVQGKFQVGTYLVARTTEWGVSPKLASTSEWGDSDSEGYTNRAPGRKDATFTANGKYDLSHKVYDLFQPGDVAKAGLWLTPAQPALSIPDLFWLFPSALNQEFNITVNMETQEVIGWTSSWGADGKFYRPGQAGTPTNTFPSSVGP